MVAAVTTQSPGSSEVSAGFQYSGRPKTSLSIGTRLPRLRSNTKLENIDSAERRQERTRASSAHGMLRPVRAWQVDILRMRAELEADTQRKQQVSSDARLRLLEAGR